jgi:hypothetical protein
MEDKLLFEMHKKNEEWFSARYQELGKNMGASFLP